MIGNGRTTALVSRGGSIDWCCLPRIDSGSCFARLIGGDEAGFCAITPVAECDTSRSYLDETAVLVTTHAVGGSVARTTDALLGDPTDDTAEESELLRVIEGVRGTVELDVRIAPRFDYGQVRPWLQYRAPGLWSFTGGDDALVVGGGLELERDGDHDLVARIVVRAGERLRLWLRYVRPEVLERPADSREVGSLDAELDGTAEAWTQWAHRADELADPAVVRSAVTLKTLTNARTGAVAAAATTSLPETLGGQRNWDYRYSWIRDSTFAVRSLAEIGLAEEADAFRRFVQRSAAGHADELQVMFGMGGERRLPEQELGLAGYRGSTPVRIGNGAVDQLQLDAYGELIGLAWHWHRRGHSPGDDDWRFLVSVVDRAAERWSEPDAGLWEMRGDPRHFVHSKALCWSALDRGIALAEECMRRAPTRRWAAARDEIREAIESDGFDRDRGTYLQAFGEPPLDAALLLLPVTGYVAWDAPEMVSTTDAIWAELDAGDGLLFRYPRSDALGGKEGASWPARSGWPSAWPGRGAPPRREGCSMVGSPAPTTSACSPRSGIPPRATCSATSRRR